MLHMLLMMLDYQELVMMFEQRNAVINEGGRQKNRVDPF
jgi:hypothetical protein